MKIWIIQDAPKKAKDVQDAIEDFHPGAIVTWLHDWSAESDRLAQFCECVTTCISPGDVVIIDLGLPRLGKPYAGLDLFKALYDSPKFHIHGALTLSVIFDTGSRETEPEIQEAIRELGLQPALAATRQRGRLYWLARELAEPIARCAVDILTGSPPRDAAPQTTTRSPQEQTHADWRYFVEHDVGNAVGMKEELAQRWRVLQERFRQVDEKIRALEALDEPFFGELRRQLRELLCSPTPDFPRLCEVLEIPPPACLQEDSASPPPASLHGIIAVIEDDLELARQLKDHLEGLGHRVVLGLRSQQDLQKVKSDSLLPVRRVERQRLGQKVQIIILDLNLGGGTEDGVRIARAIREKNSAVRIIALTRFTTDEVQQRAYQTGIDKFLFKASDQQHIQQEVAETIQTMLRVQYGPRHILVVDDQPSTVVTETFQRKLGECSCTYSVFTSPEQLEAAIWPKNPDDMPNAAMFKASSLVLLDVQFGDRQRGRELLEKINGSRPELPVIYVTGRNWTSEEQRSIIGGDAVISHRHPKGFLWKQSLADGDEKSWGKIWAQLFREPAKAILLWQEQSLRLLNAYDAEIASVRLENSECVWLCYFVLRQGEVPWKESMNDEDMKRASRGLSRTWDIEAMRTLRSNINTRISQELGSTDWQLIASQGRGKKGKFVLSLQEVTIEPPLP